MKKEIFRLIFKKELDEYGKEYTTMNNEIRKLKRELDCTQRKYELIKHIFSDFPNAEIVGIEKNKNNEELFIAIRSNTIYLFGEYYKITRKFSKLYFKVICQEVDGFAKSYIHIIDVLMEDNNIGNGTIAMNTLINYAKKNEIKWINGSLSSVDDDHSDRRNHYYEKFGFIIENSYINLYL